MPPVSNNAMKTITIDEAVDRIGIGRFQQTILLASGSCFMADSIQVLLLSFLTRRLQRDWEISDVVGSMITSCLFAGATIGTLVLGPLGDRIGRKPILLSAGLIISIFGTLTALCPNYMCLFPIIFCIGFGIGGLTVPFDILAEFLPTDERGSYLLGIKYFWTAGSMITPIIAYITLELYNSWRLFAAVCVVPSLLSVFTSQFFVPESPRWLVTKGKNEKALAVLRKAAETNGLDPYVAFPEGILLQDGTGKDVDFSELLSPRWKKTMITLAVLWGSYCFTFYASIQTVTRIFDFPEGAELDFDYAAIFVSSSAELLGTFSAIQLIDRIGRVKTLVGAFLIAGFSLFTLCALDEYANRTVMVFFAIVGRASEMSASCVTWTATAELLSTELLATGHSAVNAVARTGAFFSPYLVDDGNSLFLVGTVLFCVNMLSAFTASQLLETQGVELGKAVLIEEVRSQELEEVKSQEMVAEYRRMNGGESTFA